MIDIIRVADEADFILNGYAFKRKGKCFQILNLNRPDSATVLDENGIVLETSMDDIELKIVQEYFENNKKYLEV